MKLTLSAELERMIEEHMKAGGYASAEDVIRAGLVSLQQLESYADFKPGELDALIAEGEASVISHGTRTLQAIRAKFQHRRSDRTDGNA